MINWRTEVSSVNFLFIYLWNNCNYQINLITNQIICWTLPHTLTMPRSIANVTVIWCLHFYRIQRMNPLMKNWTIIFTCLTLKKYCIVQNLQRFSSSYYFTYTFNTCCKIPSRKIRSMNLKSSIWHTTKIYTQLPT